MSVRSNGFPTRTWKAVAASAALASVTGTGTETVLATIPIAAGAMQANGRIKVRTQWSFTGSTNAKELRVRLGGSGINGSVLMHQYINTAGVIVWYGETVIANRNSQSSQIGDPEYGNGGGQGGFAALTSAVDTTLAQNIYITGDLTNTGETITLESYSVELLPLA